LLKLKKTLALILFLYPLSSYANADSNIEISSWQENTRLTTRGKISEVIIEGKITGFLPNQVMTAFSITFDKKRNIKITQVGFENLLTDFSFLNNSLVIKFPKNKGNNQTISLYFSYEETYDKINKYLRQEVINIPNFASGADAKVTLNFPGYLESATLNPNVTKNGNSFIYKNIVPQNGVLEIIKLTEAQNVWDVTVKVKIKANQALKNITLKLPTYFQNYGQKVENFISTSNIQPLQWNRNGDNRTFKFNTDNTNLTIHSKARISTGRNNRTEINRNPNNYLEVSSEEIALLTPILEKIKRDSKYNNLPLYAKIGKFVHEFIRYDISYVDRLPKIKDILQNPIGVCTEYAKIYNSLARIAGIPSITVNGGACGEYNKCQGHAWNMIYVNNQWIEVDPTWDLMSGIVSSSHVYFNDEERGEVAFQYLGIKDMMIDSKMDFEMKSF